MRVLLDECVDKKLAAYLAGHEVTTVTRAGWSGIKNGRLLKLAASQFDVMVTVDKSLPTQQNLKAIGLAVIVMRAKSNSIENLSPLAEQLNETLERISPGELIILSA